MRAARRLRKLAAVTLAAALAPACSAVSVSELPPAPNPAQAIHWEIQRGGRLVGELFGTIHSEDPRVLNLPARVRRGFDAADTVVLELDLSRADVFLTLSGMLYGDEGQLRAIAGHALARRAIAALAEYGIPELLASRMKPWAVATTLSLPPAKTGRFLDQDLAARAAAAGKTVVGLESVAEQLGAMNALADADQTELLRETLDDIAEVRRLHEAMVEVWLAGDLDRLHAIQAESIGEDPSGAGGRFIEHLLDRRNVLMLERLLPLLNSGRVFVAVGALHLPGPTGLLQGLRERGYDLHPAR